METLTQYVRDLAVDRGRILMVTLGVVWGVLSLTVVLAFSKGFDDAMRRATVDSGVDLIRLGNGTTTRLWRGLSPGSPIRLTPEDGVLLEEAIPRIQGVSAEYIAASETIAYGDQTSNVRLHGVDPIYGAARRLPPQPGGRFLNETDVLQRRRVAFLGDEVRTRIFGGADPVGEVVTLFGLPFTVVGVLSPRITLSNYEGMDTSKIFIPSTTFKALRGDRWVAYLICWLRDWRDDRHVIDECYRVLGQRHGFDPRDDKSLGVSNHVETRRRVGSIVGSTRILMAVVTVFGFLVSLIGVANVMYVMVEERRREIGIQMALGARASRIINDRLIEGALITVAGGVVGVVSSLFVLWLLSLLPISSEARGYLGTPQFSIGTALLLAALLGFGGWVAGYWPARRAAAIDPIRVLNE